MRPSSKLFPALAFLASALPVAAGAVPLVVTHNGLMVKGSDVPVEGRVTLRFRLYSHPSGSSAQELVWASDPCELSAARGYYATTLGGSCNSAAKPLDSAHLPPGEPRFLEVSIDEQPLLPRLTMTAVPNASDTCIDAGNCPLATCTWWGGHSGGTVWVSATAP